MGKTFVRSSQRNAQRATPVADGAKEPADGDDSPAEGLGSSDDLSEVEIGQRISAAATDIPSLDPDELRDRNAGGGTGGSDGYSGRTGRGRGRKPGTKNKPKEESKSNLADIKEILLLIHAGIGMLSPIWIITDSEAGQLATAIEKLSTHYDLPVVSAKAMAWTKFVTAVGTVYGTRLIAMTIKTDDGKKTQGPQPINIRKDQQTQQTQQSQTTRQDPMQRARAANETPGNYPPIQFTGDQVHE
jgi:hypothetical protein